MVSSAREPHIDRVIQEISGFTLSRVDFPPHLLLPSHSHEMACLGLVLRGSMVEVFGKTHLHCTPRTVLLRPAGEVHSDQVHGSGAKCFILELPNSWLAYVGAHGRIMSLPEVRAPGELTRLLKSIYVELQHNDAASPLAIQSLIFEIASDLVRESRYKGGRASPIWLKRIKEKLDVCYAEKLSLADLAAEAGVHSVHLARAFRQHYSMSIGEYVRRQRIRAAALEIAAGNGSLVEIALRAGFCSQAHFCTVFKQVTGRTPLEFRQSQR